MLTPRFSLSQNDKELIIIIYARMARICDTEIHIDENCFIFYSSPYYLRLNLPGNLVDSEKERHNTEFNSDDGTFSITCIKQTCGEHFEGLDMLTDLLIPKGKSHVDKPSIEVLDNDAEVNSNSEEDEIDWFYEQGLLSEMTLLEGHKYGFANAYASVFSQLQSELCEVIDVINPDAKSSVQRREERLAFEKESFDEDHYLADMFDKEDIKSYLSYEPSFYNFTEVPSYSTSEEESLLKLPRKEFLLDGNIRRSCYFILVDVIFAWCFNHRISLGDYCSEAAWNIRKLSASLSWMDIFQNLRDVILSAFRRSLIYPLVRNWDFCELVLKDVICIFSLGRRQVLKCLLEVHSYFVDYEPYYLLNQLYIDDMCVWVQQLPEKKFLSIRNSLTKISVSKNDLELDLPELETAANLVLEEEEKSTNRRSQAHELNNVIDSIDQLTIIEGNLTTPSLLLCSSSSSSSSADRSCERSSLSTAAAAAGTAAEGATSSSSSDSSSSSSSCDSSSSSNSSSSSSLLDSDDDDED